MNNYEHQYRLKLMTPDEIVSHVESGWTICSDIGASTPIGITQALDEHVSINGLTDITYHTILEWFPMGAYQQGYSKQMKGISWYTGAAAREGINAGYGDVMPSYYRDMPSLFTEYIDIDALFVCVSPMDENGCFSTGVVGSNMEAMLKKAKRVYIEVNICLEHLVGQPSIFRK